MYGARGACVCVCLLGNAGLGFRVSVVPADAVSNEQSLRPGCC